MRFGVCNGGTPLLRRHWMGASAILRQVAAGDNNSTAAILAHLDKVLASDAFRRAERLSRFLRFTVEGVVRGEAHRIKEYVLGLEIFGRNQDYDPRLDPVVRVEARRLRAKLQEYYEQEGRDDAVRFVFPKGTYVPIFQTRVATETRPRGRLAVAAAIVFVAAVGLFSLAKYEITGPAPLRLAVVPMRAYAPPDPEEHQRLADSVAEAVLRELSRDRMLSLVSWPTVAAVRAHDGNSGALADQLGVEALAVIWVRSSGDKLLLTVHVVSLPADEKRWAEAFELQAGAEAAPESLPARIAAGIRDSLRRQDGMID